MIDLRDPPTEGEEGDNEIDWDAQLIDLRDTTATEVAKVSDLAQAGALRA